MVLLEFSMSPLGKGESVGKYVSRSLEIIDQSGVEYRLNPMGTVLEGEWGEVKVALVEEIQSAKGPAQNTLFTRKLLARVEAL